MKRIKKHPILGSTEERKIIKITVDGEEIFAYKGETIAAALLANNYNFFRHTARFNKPRAIFCGIGQCTDCAMIVNGVPNTRTCVTKVKEGMTVQTQYGHGKWEYNE